jgi:hypothetical protein
VDGSLNEECWAEGGISQAEKLLELIEQFANMQRQIEGRNRLTT